jgi:predicted ATPase/DNA-binding CsgD family transcriptional regulator
MSSSTSLPDATIYEPLSKRELEILALLAENLPDREIADRLIIAHTTVKWYNRQIFNKLGVENRREAIRAAKLLGLLGQGETDNQPKHTLIAPTTPLVGRQREIAEVAQLLHEQQARLVTILAPGGMGKTRLALAVAALPAFTDQVGFVPLAPLTSPEHLVSTIAERLGFQFGADERTPQQQLLDFLRRKTLLLVLDNFEHLLEGAALISDIVQAAPKVSVLITSRERLNLSAETVYLLEGLPFPPSDRQDDVLQYDAVQLFVQSARRMQPHFSADDMNAIVHICQLVQGMPLALDLAAAWTNTLSAAEIADEITRSLDFLQTDQRDLPERLRSIRAVFESAWQRLTTDEQAVFRRLSVFRDGGTREAAQAVTGANLKTLTGLLSKALIWRNPETNRYEIHELLRQYAAQELATAGESPAIEHAHAEYFAARAREWGKGLRDGKQLASLQLIENDFENIRNAQTWATERADAPLLEALTEIWMFYEIRGLYDEAESVCRAALERLPDDNSLTRARLLAHRGWFLGRIERETLALECCQQSIALFQQQQRLQETIYPLFSLGQALYQTAGINHAEPVWVEAHRLAIQFQDQWAITVTNLTMQGLPTHPNEPIRAKELAYQFAKSRNDYWAMGFALMRLGHKLVENGDYETAKPVLEEGIQTARVIRQPEIIADCFLGLSRLARLQGNFIEAKHHMEACVQTRRDYGDYNFMAVGIAELGYLEAKLGHYDTALMRVREALHMMRHSEHIDNITEIVIYMAAVKSEAGAKEKALELVSFVSNHPTHKILWAIPHVRLQIEQLRVELERVLPAHLYEAAWERGKGLTLENTVDDLLAEN